MCYNHGQDEGRVHAKMGFNSLVAWKGCTVLVEAELQP